MQVGGRFAGPQAPGFPSREAPFLGRRNIVGFSGTARALAGKLGFEQVELAAHPFAEFLIEEAAFAHGLKQSTVDSRSLAVERQQGFLLEPELLTVDCRLRTSLHPLDAGQIRIRHAIVPSETLAVDQRPNETQQQGAR